MSVDLISCFRLLTHRIDCAARLALPKAGDNNAARIAMMAMTTNNSMSVKAGLTGGNEENEGKGDVDGDSRRSPLRFLRCLL